MKKTLLLVAAAVALVACSNEETVHQSAPEAIGFDNAFVENSTRSVETPGYSKAKLFNDFAVYGFVEGATLFDGVKVAKDGTVTNGDLTEDWKYAGTQYWIAGANYDFYAVAPFEGGWSVKTGTASSAGATLSFTTAAGTQDLLYSGIVERQGAGSGNATVAFTFKHILSKVKFSFENGYNASAATIRVKNVQITNAYTTGDVALAATATWSNWANPGAFSFGNAAVASYDAQEAYAFGTTKESYYERLLIPANTEWNITFVVDLLVNGELIKSYNHTAKATINLQPGMSYNINAEITAANIDPAHAQEPIEFTATMTDWSTAEDKTATVDTIQQGTENN